MKQTLELLMIIFTTEAQLQTMTGSYLTVIEKEKNKKQEMFLIQYIAQKQSFCNMILNMIEDIKYQIAENNEDDRAIEVGANIKIGGNRENMENLLKAEQYAEISLYPECAETAASEGLTDISAQIREQVEKAKDLQIQIKEFI